MTPQLTVSVIIPTYNRADLLGEAIDSVLSQSLPPHELIVVNDGSTDGTAALLDSYGSAVIAIHQENQGRSNARNTGMKRATGDLIAFLDSDDRLTPDSLRVRATFLAEHPEYDVVYSRTWQVDASGQPVAEFHPRAHHPTGDLFPALICNNLGAISAYLFRRACLNDTEGFEPGRELLEDFDFFARMAVNHRFGFLDAVVSEYRHHGGMTIQQPSLKLFQQSVLLQKRFMTLPRFASLTPRQKATFFCSHGTKLLKAGQRGEARTAYVQALRLSPTMPRPYLLLAASLVR